MDKKDKKSDSEEDFEVEEVVWAKVKGFSWWPAVVIQVFRTDKDTAAKKKEYMVFFLGEYSR